MLVKFVVFTRPPALPPDIVILAALTESGEELTAASSSVQDIKAIAYTSTVSNAYFMGFRFFFR